MRILLVSGLMLLGITAATQAIEIKRITTRSAPLIMITGRIEEGDADRFAAAVAGDRFVGVILGSPGGNLLEGLRIGQMIRSRAFSTVVPSDVTCASACAFAWLGGAKRFMQADSRIGFHAAYELRNGKPVESGVGNALAGAYLAGLGLSYDAIAYIEQAHPDEITWLTERDAIEFDIAVKVLPPFRHKGGLFEQTEPPVAAKPPPRSARDIALSFPALYFAHWSERGDDAVQFFSTVYARKVNFYGTDVTINVVIEQKRKFVRLWPERVYSVRPDSVAAECHANTCRLTGVVVWDARGAGGSKQTSGSANFVFNVRVTAGNRDDRGRVRHRHRAFRHPGCITRPARLDAHPVLEHSRPRQWFSA